MQENAEKLPEGICAREKSVQETIADAKRLADLNKKMAQQLKNIGGETDPASDQLPSKTH
jgi:hypothetical protein